MKKLKILFTIITMLVFDVSAKAQTSNDTTISKTNKTAPSKSDTGKRNFRGNKPVEPYRIIQTDTIYPNNKKAPTKKQPISPKKRKNTTDSIKQSREQIKMRKDTVNSNPYMETNPVK